MAISVRQFTNPLNCDEPAYEIPIIYDPDLVSGGSDICSGNGTSTNIYGEFNTLEEIYANSSTSNAGLSDICEEGMDVVFVVDYTGSMSDAIDGVKAGINNIVGEIASQSGGNYRLGLVTFDGTVGSGNPNYGSSDYYQDLPDDQKINISNPHQSGGNIFITCQEKMNAVGNLGTSSTGFTHALNAIDSTNNSNGMSLGSSIECGGTASYEVVQNSFAGQWRSGVLKLIILITDDTPEENSTYFNNTLIPAADSNNVQVFCNIAQFVGTGSTVVDTTLYSSLSNSTTPAGQVYSGLSFANSSWVNSMINGITTLCVETTTYTCDPAPAGWYATAPIVAGTTIVYYWNGSAWTNTYTCPAPQFTVTIDVNDLIVNGSVDDIPSNAVYWADNDTFTFTGVAGSNAGTITIGCDADPGYDNLSIGVASISDSSIITSVSVNNIQNEVTFTVIIPSSNQAESLDIEGSATAIERTIMVDVINATVDSTNALGNSQSPSGMIEPSPETPASGWTNAAGTYLTYSQRYKFIAAAGTTHDIDVNFLPYPSDYSINVLSITPQYLNYNGNGTNTDVQNAFSNIQLTTGITDPQWAGQFVMPATDGWVRIYVFGQINQPLYRYNLKVNEVITGAQMVSGDSQFILNGYTGDTFNISALVEASSGYQNATVSSAILNPTFNDNSAITTGPTVNSNADGAECQVTMPAGGGNGGFTLQGSATAIQYDYVVTIVDGFDHASWASPITLTGVAGSSPTSGTIAAATNANYNFNAVGITATTGLIATIENATAPSIKIKVDSMPVGGGSGTVEVTGEESPIIYEYDLTIVTSQAVNGQFADNNIILQGAAGVNIAGSFNFLPTVDYDYSATGVSSNTITASGTLGSAPADLFDVSYAVVMPPGGGNGTLTITGATSTQSIHTATITYDGNLLSSGNYHSPTFNVGTQTGLSTVVTGITGATFPFSMYLNPSPSYWVIDIPDEVPITNNSGVAAWQITDSITVNGSAFFGPLNWNNNQNRVSGNLIMPLGGGSATLIAPKAEVTNPQYTYTVTLVENVSNLSVDVTQHVFTGVTGSSGTHTYDLVSSPGYSHAITYIQNTGAGGGVLSAVDDGNDDVLVTLNSMPQGGGSATVTVSATSTQDYYTASLVFTDSGSFDPDGDWDNSQVQFSGNYNQTFAIDNTWRISNNSRVFSGNSQIALTITPSANAFSSMNSQNPSSGLTSRTQGTFTMPLGGGNYTLNLTGRTAAALTTYACSDFNQSFDVAAGSVGSQIAQTATWNNSPIPNSLNFISNPSTYQNGNYYYTAEFLVPSGYSNSGVTMACGFSVAGTTTTTTLPLFDCTDTFIQMINGPIGDPVQYTNGTNGVDPVIVNSIFPSTYQNGSTTYMFNIAVPLGYSNSGHGNYIQCNETGSYGTLPLFSCDLANYNQPDGGVNESTATPATVSAGTIFSVSPANYTQGLATYTAKIQIPAGYSNAGGYIYCPDNATGDPCSTAVMQGAQNGVWNVPSGKEDSSTTGWGDGQSAAANGQLNFSLYNQQIRGFSNGTNDLSFRFRNAVPHSGSLIAQYLGNYTWNLFNMHAGIYTIEVINSNGCTGVYTDVTMPANNMPTFNCETSTVSINGTAGHGGPNQPGTTVFTDNPNGYTNITVSPSTWQPHDGTDWLHQYNVEFDLPPGYQPGTFTVGNGFFQMTNGTGRVSCPQQAYTSGPATTQASSGSGSGSGGGGGAPPEREIR